MKRRPLGLDIDVVPISTSTTCLTIGSHALEDVAKLLFGDVDSGAMAMPSTRLSPIVVELDDAAPETNGGEFELPEGLDLIIEKAVMVATSKCLIKLEYQVKGGFLLDVVVSKSLLGLHEYPPRPSGDGW